MEKQGPPIPTGNSALKTSASLAAICRGLM
jgi:hypothetical protein